MNKTFRLINYQNNEQLLPILKSEVNLILLSINSTQEINKLLSVFRIETFEVCHLNSLKFNVYYFLQVE